MIRIVHVCFENSGLSLPQPLSQKAISIKAQHSYSLMRIGEPPKCSDNGDITRRLTKNDQRNNLNFYVTIKAMNMNIYHSKCYFGES